MLRKNWFTFVLKKLFEWMLNLWPEYLLFIFLPLITFLSGIGFQKMLYLTLLLVGQNMSFTLVSRARQSSNLLLHAVCAVLSNGFFIFVVTAVVAHYTNIWLKLWYIVATVVGSVHAHHLSLHKLEKLKSFAKDSVVTRSDFDRAINNLEKRLDALLSKQNN